MSPIGRILIVLNLILSAAFVGWAANALGKTEKYKEDLVAAKQAHTVEVAKKDEELSKLGLDLNGVTEQQRQMREQRDMHETEANRLKTQLDDLKRAHDTLSANLTKIQATLGDYNNSIAQLSQQKDAAVERAHEAERARDAAVSDKDAAELAKNDAEEATRNAQRQIADLQGQSSTLEEQVGTLEARIAQIVDVTGFELKDAMAQPKIDAYVLNVDRGLKLVILNKGKKDNVKEGYTFDVYRGSQYKGQVRIQDVQEGMSSGLIVSEKNAIATGDQATTTL
jgi:predicted  nucleic acid-binding Zn-ribbon protein